VQTTGATSFEVACASIANGQKVDLKGTASGGVVTATRIKQED
jgi:hypothetical protein